MVLVTDSIRFLGLFFFKRTLLRRNIAEDCGYWLVGGGVVSSVQERGQNPADGAGPGPAVQWRLPLTGSVSSQPGRHGRASQTAAAVKLHGDKQEDRKLR